MCARRRGARRGGSRRRLNAASAGFWKNVGNMIKQGAKNLVSDIASNPTQYLNKAVNAGRAVVGAYKRAAGTGGMYRRRRRGGRRSKGMWNSAGNL